MHDRRTGVKEARFREADRQTTPVLCDPHLFTRYFILQQRLKLLFDFAYGFTAFTLFADGADDLGGVKTRVGIAEDIL